MKRRFIFLCAAVLINVSLFAQNYEYQFTDIKVNPATTVKNQAKTGTCWSFATASFIESELLKNGKGEFDLSEMFIVRKVYEDRMDDYYFRKGKGNLGPGAVSHVFLKAMERYGLVPDEVYPGVDGGSGKHNHGTLQKYVEAVSIIAVNEKKKMPDALKNGVLDAYLGVVPEKFKYKGKEYTPKSFYKALGLNADDYVEITSFTHHPFYQQIPLEIPDNFDHALYYNVPVDDMIEIMDYAINNGYTIAWDCDLSEKCYDFKKHIALMSDQNIKHDKVIEKRYEEIPVTQETRQQMFEAFETVDDHLEHIVGLAKDQEGVKYYKTKNSWGTDRNGDGYHYVSENYIKGKTIAITVNKKAIPKNIKEKLNIK